ncbi:hypothetical protein [Leminorella grimontii]|uniref:hypothetical protein n=1 Tax=Leminorella grimontii TaxID=82981 RepID=UPI002089A74E|nr:hypothetical protein [Leminorella grimontii]GKX60227.1 hypothetical protein SOASR031_25420 [Leminorella grimontii]
MSRSISASVLNNSCKSDDFCSLLEQIGGQRNGKKEYAFEIKGKYIWLFYTEDKSSVIREIELKLSSTHDNYNSAIDLIKIISVNMELLIDVVGEKKFSLNEFCLIKDLSRSNFEPDDEFFIFSQRVVVCLKSWECAQKNKEYIDCMWTGIVNVNNNTRCLDFSLAKGGFYKKDEDALLRIFDFIAELSEIDIYATVRFYLKNKHIDLLYDIY